MSPKPQFDDDWDDDSDHRDGKRRRRQKGRGHKTRIDRFDPAGFDPLDPPDDTALHRRRDGRDHD